MNTIETVVELIFLPIQAVFILLALAVQLVAAVAAIIPVAIFGGIALLMLLLIV